MSLAGVLTEVLNERERQDKKWGEQNHEPNDYLAILAEEFGEAAKESVEYTWEINAGVKAVRLAHLRVELIQTAAVAVAMVEAIDRRGD